MAVAAKTRSEANKESFAALLDQFRLTEQEVQQRKKKYGLNQMKEEKENLFFKFLGYFVGPIQFVMEAAAVLAGKIHSSCSLAS